MIPKPPPAESLNYDVIRPQVRTGDILLFRGKGPTSRIIQWGSKSPYSHAGIAARWGNRLMVFQSARRGVEVLPASTVVDKYEGQVDWWSVRSELREHVREHELMSACIEALGTPFSSFGIIRLMWLMLIRRFRGHKDTDRAPEQMFCSWYVSLAFRRAGLDLVDVSSDDCTSPGDIANSKAVELRGCLHRDPEAEGVEPVERNPDSDIGFAIQ